MGFRIDVRTIFMYTALFVVCGCSTTQTDRPNEESPPLAEEKETEILPAVLDEIDGYIRAWETAVRSGEEANARNLEDALAHVAKENFSMLVEAMKGERSDAKAIAAAALGFSRDKRAVVWLVRALADRDSMVRNNAAFGLAILRDETTPTEKLAHVMLNDPDDEVRGSAALAISRLVRVGDAKGVYDAIVMACGDSSHLVRLNAVAALTVIEDIHSLGVLIDRMNNDYEPSVRMNAIVGVLRIGGRKAMPHVIPRLKDSDEKVVQVAREGLKRLAGVDLGEDPMAWEDWIRKNPPPEK